MVSKCQISVPLPNGKCTIKRQLYSGVFTLREAASLLYIAGNFQGINFHGLVKNITFVEKTFVNVNTCFCVTHKVLSVEAKKSEQGRLVLERNVKQLQQKLDEAMSKDATSPYFMEKTFANSHKTAKFMKVFSLKSFLLYGIFQH